MRFKRLGTLLFVLGSAMLAGAAEPAKPETGSWLSRMMPSGKKPEAEKTFGNTPLRPPVVIAPLEPSAIAEALKAEQQAWDRRMEVCLKLRMIADKTNNDALAKQADDLEKQATALYHHRSARLGVKAPLRGKPEATAPIATTTPERSFKVVNP
jgi:hypothetical protein